MLTPLLLLSKKDKKRKICNHFLVGLALIYILSFLFYSFSYIRATPISYSFCKINILRLYRNKFFLARKNYPGSKVTTLMRFLIFGQLPKEASSGLDTFLFLKIIYNYSDAYWITFSRGLVKTLRGNVLWKQLIVCSH